LFESKEDDFPEDFLSVLGALSGEKDFDIERFDS